MKSDYDFAVSLRKIAVMKNLALDEEALIAVHKNNRQCLCDLSKACPCAAIASDGCPCGLFVPRQEKKSK